LIFKREKRTYKGPAARVALYARVSTQEGRQHLSNQLDELRRYAKRMNWGVAGVYSDQASGAKSDRPGLDKMLEAAARRAFDVVLVFDLSRLTRSGPASAFHYIDRLSAAGVQFHSFREEYFRTTGPAGPMLIAIAAYIAEQERTQMQHRIKAGIARAKAAGVRFGRPSRILDRAKIQKLRKQGKSIRDIARKLGTTKSTIMRRLKP
jgi:DNA invertase Pin-like site-specific DNA recombinase